MPDNDDLSYRPEANNIAEYAEDIEDFESTSSSDYEGGSGHRIRRGSEGYEIKTVDRDEILRRYVTSRGEDAGRYNWYVPENYNASDEEDVGNEDNVPLADTLAQRNFQSTDITE